MNTRTTKQLLMIAVAILIFVGCSSESKLLGYWESSDGTLEFFDDGTAIMNNFTRLEYAVADSSTLRFDGFAGSVIMKFKVSGDTLTVWEDGQTQGVDDTIFTRTEK